jgi:glycosyltransferase involved in cell wall biosynthesis
MRLHLLGLPHTVTDEAHSHCAYTGKVLKFAAMMKPFGYEIVHYGVEGAEVDCERVTIMSRAEQMELMGGKRDEKAFVGDVANIDSLLYHRFNQRLREALLDRVLMRDLVLMPFGHGHGEAVRGLPFHCVESGIGYPDLYGAPFRIYESYAWLHWHQGRENRNGHNYEWVVPNYFDVDAWTANLDPDPNLVVYFGRICDIKGLPTVVEVARRRPDLRFVICGQGDPKPYLVADNIEYRPPISGRERSDLLGSAMAVIMPSVFTEPFGGVAVEAQLCGTPVLTTTYGAFTETVEDEVTGFRCHTLGDFLAGLERAPELNRAYIAARARALYGFERVGKMYDRAFRMIEDLRGNGWYSMRSAFGPVTKVIDAG